MEIGIIYPQTELGGDPRAVRDFALAAEARGYAHLVVYDHVAGAVHEGRDPPLTGPYTEKDPFHDPFVMLSHIAAITTRLELVTGVLVLPQRQTLLVARQAADLDLLSGERFRMGIGIGWNHVEYSALGQPFRARGKHLGEQVELLRRLWTEPQVTFEGEFDHMDRVTLNPRPNRPVPIWMGGFSRAALERAARIGDGFIFSQTLGSPAKLMDRMKACLAEAGRDPAGFGLQLNLQLGCPVEEIVERATQWRDMGGTHLSVNTMGHQLNTFAGQRDYLDRAADALGKAGLMG